jgi:cytochrome c2
MRALIFTTAAVVVAASAVPAWFAWRQSDEQAQIAVSMTGGDIHRAKAAMRRYGCAGCHRIPGVVGARGQVGPSLNYLAGRIYIAGSLPNTPENLIRWIANPREINPRTAMPVTGIPEAAARDVAAYLYSR